MLDAPLSSPPLSPLDSAGGPPSHHRRLRLWTLLYDPALPCSHQRPACLRVLLDEEARYTRWEQERRRQERQQERASATGSATLGRPFSRSYASGLQRSSDKEKRGSSLRVSPGVAGERGSGRVGA